MTPAARLQAAVRGAGFELPSDIRHDVDADLELVGTPRPAARPRARWYLSLSQAF